MAMDRRPIRQLVCDAGGHGPVPSGIWTRQSRIQRENVTRTAQKHCAFGGLPPSLMDRALARERGEVQSRDLTYIGIPSGTMLAISVAASMTSLIRRSHRTSIGRLPPRRASPVSMRQVDGDRGIYARQIACRGRPKRNDHSSLPRMITLSVRSFLLR